MKNDSNLIYEAYSSKFASEKPVTNHLISQLRLMHDRLNEMSTAISLSRSPEIDQLLSHIRDLADMLITEQPNKNEDAEMPEKDFIKLKQHINKGPIQVKNNSKELPYTHKYIHQLAKQDPREGQKEENAEDICIEDLAAKHGVSLEQLQKQLEMGLKVETEHTENMDVAKKIALDHLNEDPNYYTKLAKMEGKSENAESNGLNPAAHRAEDLGNGYSIQFDEIREPDNRYYYIHLYKNLGNGKYSEITSFYPSGNDGDKMHGYVGAENPKSRQMVIDLINKYLENKLPSFGTKAENEERRIDPKCWKGYHKAGTKLKGGVRVNNCVKNK